MEIPSWVAENEELLRLVHSAIVDQCRRGSGYPTALIEAHEQAVVNTSNRRDFTHLIETALYKHHMPVYSSEKNRSKRLRSLATLTRVEGSMLAAMFSGRCGYRYCF